MDPRFVATADPDFLGSTLTHLPRERARPVLPRSTAPADFARGFVRTLLGLGLVALGVLVGLAL